MTYVVKLKKQLALYLRARGMTASELARASGVSKQVLSSWINGSEPKRISQVKKVAEILKVSVDNLVFGEGIKNEEPSEDLNALLRDEWIGGLFEIRLRRVKREEKL